MMASDALGGGVGLFPTAGDADADEEVADVRGPVSLGGEAFPQERAGSSGVSALGSSARALYDYAGRSVQHHVLVSLPSLPHLVLFLQRL